MKYPQVSCCQLLAGVTLALVSGVLQAESITVITSFPKELTEAYKKA